MSLLKKYKSSSKDTAFKVLMSVDVKDFIRLNL